MNQQGWCCRDWTTAAAIAETCLERQPHTVAVRLCAVVKLTEKKLLEVEAARAAVPHSSRRQYRWAPWYTFSKDVKRPNLGTTFLCLLYKPSLFNFHCSSLRRFSLLPCSQYSRYRSRCDDLADVRRDVIVFLRCWSCVLRSCFSGHCIWTFVFHILHLHRSPFKFLSRFVQGRIQRGYKWNNNTYIP